MKTAILGLSLTAIAYSNAFVTSPATIRSAPAFLRMAADDKSSTPPDAAAKANVEVSTPAKPPATVPEVSAKTKEVIAEAPPAAAASKPTIVAERTDIKDANDALNAIQSIQKQMAEAKGKVESGAMEQKAYLSKLKEYTVELDKITQKMETIKTANTLKLEKLNQAVAQLEGTSQAATMKLEHLNVAVAQLEESTQQFLSKLGDVSIELASSGITDML